MTVQLLTEHHLEFLSLKGGCTGSSESTLVKMPHCWKSHVVAQMFVMITIVSYPMVFPFSHHHSRSETSSWVHARTREFHLLRTTINAILTIIQCTCAGIGSFYRPFIFFFKYGLVMRDPGFGACEKQNRNTDRPAHPAVWSAPLPFDLRKA